jgi:hypothetical protein
MESGIKVGVIGKEGKLKGRKKIKWKKEKK